MVRSLRGRIGRVQETTRRERYTFIEVERADRRTDTSNQSIDAASLNFHGVWRKVDNVLLPTEGLSVSVQTGLGYARSRDANNTESGSDSGPYGRVVGRVSAWLPLGGNFFGEARFEAGQVFVKDSVAVPDTQLFRAGGDDSVRGYAYRSLGPIVDGSVAGGRVMSTASIEIARPVSDKLPIGVVGAFCRCWPGRATLDRVGSCVGSRCWCALAQSCGAAACRLGLGQCDAPRSPSFVGGCGVLMNDDLQSSGVPSGAHDGAGVAASALGASPNEYADKRGGRRWAALALVALLGLVLLVVVLGAGSLWWVTSREGGAAAALARVPGLKVDGQAGPLTGGAFSARRLEYRMGDTIVTVHDLAWRDAAWQWRPQPGQWVGLRIESPSATRVEVRTAGTPSVTPQSLRLPMSLTLQDLRIDALAVDERPLVSNVHGTLHIGAQNGATHRIENLAFTWQKIQAEAKGTVGADAPMPVDIDLTAHNAEASAAVPWQGQATLKGPLMKLDVVAALRAEPRPTATKEAPTAGTQPSAATPAAMSLDARTTIEPFAPWPLTALDATLRDFDAAAFATDAPSTRIGGAITLAMPSRDAPLQLRATLNNTAPGRWDQGALPVAKAIVEVSGGSAGKLAETTRVQLSRLELELADQAGRVEGEGLWDGESLKLQLDTRALRPSRIDNRLAAMTLGGPLSLDVKGVPSPQHWLAEAPSKSAAKETVLDARLQGRLQGRLEGASGDAAQPPATVTVDARLLRHQTSLEFQVDKFIAESAGAKAQWQGRAERKGRGPWSITAEGELRDFDPLPWYAGAPGSAWREGRHRFNGRFKASASLPQQVLEQGTVPVRELILAARGRLDAELLDNSTLAGVPLQGSLNWRNEEGTATLRATASSGSNTTTLDARIGAQIGAQVGDEQVQWRVQAPQLATLAPLARLHPSTAALLPMAGSLQAEIDTEGRWPQPATRGKLTAKELQVGTWRLGSGQSTWRMGAEAQAALQATLDLQDLSELGAAGTADAKVEQRRIESAKLSIDGSLSAHRFSLQALSPIRPPAWGAALAGDEAAASRGTSFVARGEGRWSSASSTANAPNASLLSALLDHSGVWRLQLDQLAISPRQGSTSWVDAEGLRAELGFDAGLKLTQAMLDPGRLSLAGADLRWTEARWSRDLGRAAPPALNINAQLEPLRVAPLLARLAPGYGLGGDLQVGGKLEVRSTAERFAVEAVIERRSGDLSLSEEDGGLTQDLGLTDLRFALTAQDGTWHFSQAAAGTNLGVLAGAQSMRVPAATRWPAASTPLEGVMSWRVDNLSTLAPWLPPGWRAGGTLTAGASLGGRFGAPELSGTLSGAQLSLRSALEGVDLRDGELQLMLRAQEATIQRFVFKGGAGELRLEGGATFGPGGAARLSVDAKQFQMLGRVDRRIVTTGRATAIIKPDELQVDGRFTVDEGLIDLSRRDAPKLDDDVSVVRSDDDKESNKEATLFPEEPAEDASSDTAARRGPLSKTRLNVQLDLGPALRLKGRGINTRLAGTLAITSPANRIAVNGSVRAESGTYTAYGQNLVIKRGVIRFTGPVENPQLDIAAGRDNLDVEVGVAITGSTQNPRVRLTSEPEMNDIDKLSWLILGRAPDGAGPRRHRLAATRRPRAVGRRRRLSAFRHPAQDAGPRRIQRPPDRQRRRPRHRHPSRQTDQPPLVHRLRTRRQRQHRHLAGHLPRGPAPHRARTKRQRQLTRHDLVVAVEVAVEGGRLGTRKSLAFSSGIEAVRAEGNRLQFCKPSGVHR